MEEHIIGKKIEEDLEDYKTRINKEMEEKEKKELADYAAWAEGYTKSLYGNIL